MDGQKRSNIWIHFSIISNEKAKCHICKNIYSYKGGSLSNLKKHLKNKHPTLTIELEEPAEKILKGASSKAVTVYESESNKSDEINVGKYQFY